MIEWVRKALGKDDAKHAARRRLDGAAPRRGEVAIDGGANVGRIAARLARRGGIVYAFEPNPHAFEVLQRRFARRPNVVCRNQAVYDEPGSMRLHLHTASVADPVKWSTGSSLLGEKDNVDPEAGVEVEVIDLAAFIESLDRHVKALKLDVEGAECRILERLIDTGLIHRIDHVFVEMHDHRIASLREPAERVARRLAEGGLDHVHLDWP